MVKTGDPFSSYHPAVNFLFFLLVLVFTMFLLHPVSLAVSLISAVTYAVLLKGGQAVGRSLRWLLPMMLLAVVINPAFNHQGETVLCQLPTGNPLTLESIWHGLALAVLLGAVVLWFTCYTAVVTSDKFIYLFGRVIPSLSLVLSMTLRFVPSFTRRFQVVRESQRCVGRDISEGSLPQRVRSAVTILSILVTWSLENAIETADSMKSRGYGLKGRTAFSIYPFEERDRTALAWLGFCGVYVLAGWLSGGMAWQYTPTVEGTLTGAFPISFQIIYLALCMTPVILHRKEARRWKPSRSET